MCFFSSSKIYASNNYGNTLIRIWTDEYASWILNPIVFSDTGHIAFIYRLNNHLPCCQYFAIFSKAGEYFRFHLVKSNEYLGLYYGWRTRIFRSFMLMMQPFFFDSSGSLYFNTTPPLLVILAGEQSLVATSNVIETIISIH